MLRLATRHATRAVLGGSRVCSVGPSAHEHALTAVASVRSQGHLENLRPALRHRFCAGSLSSDDDYHKRADFTLESVLEVFEDRADEAPQLAMEVDYAVRARRR